MVLSQLGKRPLLFHSVFFKSKIPSRRIAQPRGLNAGSRPTRECPLLIMSAETLSDGEVSKSAAEWLEIVRAYDSARAVLAGYLAASRASGRS